MELVTLHRMHPDTRRMSSWKTASVVLHVAVLAAVAYQVPTIATTVRKHGTARILTPYAPGRSAAAQPPKPKIVRIKEEPKLAMKEPAPPPPSSGDPSGEADVTLAMASFFPAPKPNLSELPHGTSGDIVVDVTIDEDGKVVDTKVDQGLGHGVDEAVLAVLQTWTFYPATKAGKPVPSVQQLLFHFDRA
jgi:protein TonB